MFLPSTVAFLAQPNSDTSVDFYNVGNCPPRNWLSVHIKVNKTKQKKMWTILVETILVELGGTIPCCAEGFLQPRQEKVEALINLIETLGLEQTEPILLQLSGTFGDSFLILDSTWGTVCRSIMKCKRNFALVWGKKKYTTMFILLLLYFTSFLFEKCILKCYLRPAVACSCVNQRSR